MKAKSKSSVVPVVPAQGRRANRVHATILKPKAKIPGVTAATRLSVPEAMAAAPQFFTMASGIAQGTIRLEPSTMGPLDVLKLLTIINDGLTGNVYYDQDFPAATRTGITTAKAAIATGMESLASAEAYVRTLRAALEYETQNGRIMLRSAASACQSIDSSDEALSSVGWSLRRGPGRPKPVSTPANLSLKNTLFGGGVQARWRRIDNATFYEYQFVTGIANPDAIIWESLPVIAHRTVSFDFSGLPIGEFLSFHVRAVGAKGFSPWSETATVRVN